VSKCFLHVSFFLWFIPGLFALTEDERAERAFFSAVKAGDIEAVLEALESKKIEDIDLFDPIEWTPLQAAVVFKQKEMIAFLIQSGADINKVTLQDTALFWAVLMDDVEIASFLLHSGADFTIRSKVGTMLELAIKRSCFAMVELLVECNAVVTKKDIILARKKITENAQIIAFLEQNCCVQ
jgi:ankyrin repeat protein